MNTRRLTKPIEVGMSRVDSNVWEDMSPKLVKVEVCLTLLYGYELRARSSRYVEWKKDCQQREKSEQELHLEKSRNER